MAAPGQEPAPPGPKRGCLTLLAMLPVEESAMYMDTMQHWSMLANHAMQYAHRLTHKVVP